MIACVTVMLNSDSGIGIDVAGMDFVGIGIKIKKIKLGINLVSIPVPFGFLDSNSSEKKSVSSITGGLKVCSCRTPRHTNSQTF